MRKAILIGILLFAAALLTFGQHRKTTKPKAKTRSTPASKAKWEQYTPCGVFYKTVDDFIDEIGKGWRFIGETNAEQVWYDADNQRCTDNGILKAWVKRM